ncbi:unnamed protein product, partial [Strongylus vulgaris]
EEEEAVTDGEHDAEEVAYNVVETEKEGARKKRRRKRIYSLSSESAISESNIVSETRKSVRSRNKREKKLSAKAQALLNETLELTSDEGRRGGTAAEGDGNTSQQEFEGYDEESAAKHETKLTRRRQMKAKVPVKHAMPIKRQPNKAKSRKTQERSIAYDSQEQLTNKDSKKQFSASKSKKSKSAIATKSMEAGSCENSASFPISSTVASVEEDGGSMGGSNAGESVNERSSLTRVTPAVTPVPHETELSRPRRCTKAKALPKPISVGKRQPNKPKAKKNEKTGNKGDLDNSVADGAGAKSATLTEGEEILCDSNDLEPGMTADGVSLATNDDIFANESTVPESTCSKGGVL